MGSGGWRLEALESGGQSADGGFERSSQRDDHLYRSDAVKTSAGVFQSSTFCSTGPAASPSSCTSRRRTR